MRASPNSLPGRIATWLRSRPPSVCGPDELTCYRLAYESFCRRHFVASPLEDGQPVGVPLSADGFADFVAHLKAHHLFPQQRQVSPHYEQPPRYEYVLPLGPDLAARPAPSAGADPLRDMVAHWLRSRSVTHSQPIVARTLDELASKIVKAFRDSHPGYGVNDLDVLDTVAHAMGFDSHRVLMGSAVRRSDGGCEFRLSLSEPVS